MKKNSIIGFVLIGLILIGFSWYNTKTFQEQERVRMQQDSVAALNAAAAFQDSLRARGIDTLDGTRENAASVETIAYKDSLLTLSSQAEERFFTLSNEKIEVKYTNRGAQPYSVKIKDYSKAGSDTTGMYLIEENSGNMALEFYSTHELLNTSDFCFDVVEQSDTSLVFRLNINEKAYIDYRYTLPSDTYMLGFDIKMVGMQGYVNRKRTHLNLIWNQDIPRLEKGYKNEKYYSTVAYKYHDESSVETLGRRVDNGKEEIKSAISWFAFQQQFFSAILVAENNFGETDLDFSFYPESDPSRRLMECNASAYISYQAKEEFDIPMNLYFGPNLYNELKSYDMNFEKIVPLGWGIIGWISRFVIIPVFDFLGSFINSFGLIILLMTILIKLVISPFTYKSYLSSAKMRVLRPEIEKINERYPKPEDAMKKQQATMALYQKTGVSMMGGCLPMLLQFPILIAMYSFFPTSFELRQQPFLWAEDLSTYDSILDLPFNIPLYGDHISLFALLMALTMFLYTKISMKDQPTAPGMGGMKFMTLYFMPLFMLCFCNTLSAALSYYYMLSNLFTMVQTWVIRRFIVNEDKLYEQLKAKAANSKARPKSKFQKRLEEMQKQQEAMMKQQNRK